MSMDIGGSLFQRSLAFTMRWEGGYVNHPADPGGATNKGVTQSVYDAWRRAKGLPTQSVRSISSAEVREIYYQSYWEPHCADFQWPLCLALFDTRVNFGIRGAAFLVQPIVGATVDGIWGRQTQGLLLDYQGRWGPQRLAGEIAAARLRYRVQRVSAAPNQRVFLAGWINRDVDLFLEVIGR